MRKFWNWVSDGEKGIEKRVLTLNGVIAEESWFDDEVTPQVFKEELYSSGGDITVWINSPGGDCIAAAQIYNMLLEYKGDVTVKVDGIAASAASVIAMAGTKVMMSPVSMLMIHNPITMATGDTEEMKKAIAMLAEIKESIVNAYELKTGMNRDKIAKLMDAETWMDANKAIELGFADEIIGEKVNLPINKSILYSEGLINRKLINKMVQADKIEKRGRRIYELMESLSHMKQKI